MPAGHAPGTLGRAGCGSRLRRAGSLASLHAHVKLGLEPIYSLYAQHFTSKLSYLLGQLQAKRPALRSLQPLSARFTVPGAYPVRISMGYQYSHFWKTSKFLCKNPSQKVGRFPKLWGRSPPPRKNLSTCTCYFRLNVL